MHVVGGSLTEKSQACSDHLGFDFVTRKWKIFEGICFLRL